MANTGDHYLIKRIFDRFGTGGHVKLHYKELSAALQIHMEYEQQYADLETRTIIGESDTSYPINTRGCTFEIFLKYILGHIKGVNLTEVFILKNMCGSINPNHIDLIKLINKMTINGEIEFYCSKMAYDIYASPKTHLRGFELWSPDSIEYSKQSLIRLIHQFATKAVDIDIKAIKEENLLPGVDICTNIITNYKKAITAWYRLMLHDSQFCTSELERKISGYALRIRYISDNLNSEEDSTDFSDDSGLGPFTLTNVQDWSDDDFFPEDVRNTTPSDHITSILNIKK